jgi:hypothetical protein
MTSTARVRAHRDRRKRHIQPLRVEVPFEALSERLVEDGRLGAWDADDSQQVAKAVELLLKAYLDST